MSFCGIKKRSFRVLYGQICHLADEYLIMTQGVLYQNSTAYTTLTFPGTATVRKSHFSLSSCDLQSPLRHWCLIDFAAVESCSVITSNYMSLLPCHCLHVLCLILDCANKRFPLLSLIPESSNNYSDCLRLLKAGNQKRLSVLFVWDAVFPVITATGRR